MGGEQKTVVRYSMAFKQKVVGEIERGEIGVEKARRIYAIGGGETIQKWLRIFGKQHLLAKVVRIEMKGETDRVKELMKEKKALESALAQAHLKIIALESMVEVAEEDYGLDLKKKSGLGVRKEVLPK